MQSKVVVEPQMRARIPLYAAGLTASGMGVAALHAVLPSGEFTSFAFALIVIGYCVSWGVRAKLISNSALAAIGLIIMLPTLAFLLIEPQFRYQLIPTETLDSPDLLAAIVMASLMVIYSFKLTTDMSVLFLCVPSLSLIGLLATADPSAEMLAYFGIYLGCASFVLIRQNVLSGQKDETAAKAYQAEPAEGKMDLFSWSSIKLHLSMALGMALTALAVGSLIGTMLSPMIARAFMARLSDIDTGQTMDQSAEEFVPIATGPVTLSERETMTVKCSRPLLWRERTYNHYTGQGWSSELLPQEQRWIYPPKQADETGSHTFRITDPLNPDPRSAVEIVEQTYRITNGFYRTIFAAAEPFTVNHRQWPRVMRISAGLEAGVYSRGYTYHVVSKVSVATPRELRIAPTVYPELITARYLVAPQSCWQVQKLTTRVTEASYTPFDKAQAIQSFLAANYTYATNALAAPSDKDAVTYFLLDSKRGYCDIFASAMVVMARQAGIPARWATGFAPGEYDPDDGVYHVKSKDRHAWAELYFPGYGWIPFDVAADQQGVSWLANVKEYWAMFAADRASVFAGALILFLFAYLFKAEVLPRIGRNLKKPAWQRTTGVTEIGECYQRMCRILARHGYRRYPAVTPLEYAFQTNKSIRLGEISQTVDILTADFVEFRYSNREPAPERIQAMKSNLEALANGLKTAKRGKLLPKQQHS